MNNEQPTGMVGDELNHGNATGAGGAQRAPGVSDILGTLDAMVAAEGPVPEIADYVTRPVPPLLIVLTGPSGVGKDKALERMRARGLPFHYVVTVTTRGIREGEVHGRDYFFLSKPEYEQMLLNNQLLEHAQVYDNYYGVPLSQVIEPLRAGEDVILKPDVQGAATIRKVEPNAVFIFLAPPSMEELARRLYYRKTEDPGELARRFALSRLEMQALSDFDYVVVNHHNKLDETVDTIVSIIRAEKCRVHPRRLRLTRTEL